MALTRPCSRCEKLLAYKTAESFSKAQEKNTMCPSCRTLQNNKSEKRNNKRDKNPSWKGYNDVSGKTFSKLKRDALIRKLSFDITIQDISEQFEKQQKLCAFTGMLLNFDDNASVDRIDSTKGYSKNNIQIVHKILNMMKKDMPNAEFILWCQHVANNNNKQSLEMSSAQPVELQHKLALEAVR